MVSRRSFTEMLLGGAATALGAGSGHAQVARGTGAEAPVVGSPSAAGTLPAGYRKPGAMRWGWAADSDGILPNWKGGDGTLFDPSFLEWNDDQSVTLRLDDVGGVWTAGELQVTRPTRPISERWGAVLSSERPSAVCALFAYGKDGTEIDFEWRGDRVWQLNLHLFDVDGNRINPSPIPTVAVDVSQPHAYEFSMTADGCLWFVDGEEVARVTPADMPGAVWNPDAKLELLVSIEHHGAWAKHDYADVPAVMTLHGLLV